MFHIALYSFFVLCTKQMNSLKLIYFPKFESDGFNALWQSAERRVKAT